MIIALVIISVAILISIGFGALILIKSGDLMVFVFATGALAFLITFLTSFYFRNKHILAHKIQRVCKIIYKVAGVNFISLIIISLLFGGTAPNGKIESGLYFLGDHGNYREVSSIIYFISFAHTISVIFTHILAMLAGWVYAMTGGDRRQKIKPHILKLLPKKNDFPKSKI